MLIWTHILDLSLKNLVIMAFFAKFPVRRYQGPGLVRSVLRSAKLLVQTKIADAILIIVGWSSKTGYTITKMRTLHVLLGEFEKAEVIYSIILSNGSQSLQQNCTQSAYIWLLCEGDTDREGEKGKISICVKLDILPIGWHWNTIKYFLAFCSCNYT